MPRLNEWLAAVGILLMLFILVLFTGVAGGCSHSHQKHVLKDQILTVHPDFKGLVNHICKEYDWKSNCKKWDLEKYDLSDPAVRSSLQRLQFVCKVGGKMFVPCPDKNGLCRYTYGKRPFLGIIGKKPRKEEFLSFDIEHSFLISAKTTCTEMDGHVLGEF